MQVNRFVNRNSILFLLIVISTKLSQAQMVGSNCYIQGTSVELAINGDGGFEGVDQATSLAPIGYHARTTTAPFGFIANPLVDGWVIYDGDFYTPGTPENGWGIEIGTTSANANNNYLLTGTGGTPNIPGSITGYSLSTDCKSVDWEGQDTRGGTNLHIKLNYFLQTADLYYTTTVSITNNTSDTIPDMYYYRSFDPDNNAELDGASFPTNNTIVSQPTSGDCNLAHVSATSFFPAAQPMSYVGLAGVDSNFRVCFGGFSNRDGSNLWNGTGFTQTVGSVDLTTDEAIALSYRIENLPPGATRTFRFVTILSDAAASNAINNLLHLDFVGSSGLPPAACRADTAKTCGSPVAIGVSGAATEDFTWNWAPSTGLSATTTPSVVANPPSTTTYTITGTPVSACATLPVYIYVTVLVVPGEGNNPVITPVPPKCVDDAPFNLVADSTGGVWIGPGITDASLGTFDPATGVGTYVIKYVTPGYCNTSDTVTIVVHPRSPAVTITQPAKICVNHSPVTLAASVPGGIWTGIGITDTTAGTFDPSIPGAGIHIITYTLPGICPSFDTVGVNVIALPVLSLVADTTEGCPPTTVTFTGITDQPGGHYSWDFGNSSSLADTSTLAMPTYTYVYPGSYSVSFTYTNTIGCKNDTTASGLITVHPQPVALMEITPKPTIILTPTVNFLDHSTGSAIAWLWDFGSFGSSSLQNPTIVYNDTGSFPVQLIITSIYGCLDTATDNAYIAPVYSFYAPNAFTPNADGINDVFRAYGSQMNSDGFEMYIFDRWGNKVFRTVDPYEGWNGSMNNTSKIAESDVYVYKIRVKDYSGLMHEYIGQVTLIK